MAKPNYHHARKQKELARKARQQEKQQRRAVRENAPGEETQVAAVDAPAPAGPDSGSGV
jgi:hypothetical protein